MSVGTATSLMGLGMPGPLANIAGWDYTTIAATGASSTHALASQALSKLCVVTGGDGTKGVKMPDVGIGEPVLMVNNSGSNLLVYPYTITDTFIATGTPVVSTIATYAALLAIKVTATTWAVMELPTGV